MPISVDEIKNLHIGDIFYYDLNENHYIVTDIEFVNDNVYMGYYCIELGRDFPTALKTGSFEYCDLVYKEPITKEQIEPKFIPFKERFGYV